MDCASHILGDSVVTWSMLTLVCKSNSEAMHMKNEYRLKFDQIFILVNKDFKLKYNSTALGFLWSILVPLVTSCVYYFVFGVMMRFNEKNYLLYLMSGTFLWQFFSNVVMQSGTVLSGNVALLKKTSFDRSLLVSGTFFTEAIHFLLTIPVLLIIMWLYGVQFNLLTFIPNFIVCIVSLYLFSVGVGYAYAAYNLFFRDLERIVVLLLMMWMFCSPVFVPLSAIPDEYLWIFDINPMAMILGVWRDMFYVPDWHPFMYARIVIISVVVHFGGYALFRKMDPVFAEMM